MSYKKEYIVGLEDIGKENLITNVAILKILEEIAEQNSAEVGLGLENIEETRLAWLLLDWRVEILKRPKYEDKIIAETWSSKLERCYGYRDFEIYNEKNELIIKGTSKWVLIDIEKRKPVRLEESYALKYEKYNDKGYNVFNDELKKVEVAEDLNFVGKYKVQRRDIDINNHMHNISYLEVANEILPFEIYEKNVFNNIRISYKKELKYGDNVDCYYSKEDNKHIITLKNGDILNAIIELY